MKHLKRLPLALVAMLLFATALLPATASAQADHDDPTVEGRGWLWAKGTGNAEIDMAGRIQAQINGDVTIVDHAGDLRLFVNNREDDLAEARSLEIELDDFVGGLEVRGSHFTIELDGEMRFRAHGKGQAYLDGNGVYKTRRGPVRVWDGMVRIEDPEVQPA